MYFTFFLHTPLQQCTLQHSDEIVKEHSLFILLAFAKDEQVCTYMFNYGLACSIFDVLKLVMDPDIQVNSLMLFDLLLDVPDIETFFQSPNKYTLKLLLCYLKSEYFVIREIAVKILIKMSTFRSAAIEAKMIKDGIITTMFTYLMVCTTFIICFCSSSHSLLAAVLILSLFCVYFSSLVLK